MKKLFIAILTFIVIVCAVVVAVVISNPICDFSFIAPDANDIEMELSISWNTKGLPADRDEFGILRIERYFSIERYYDGDINDAFYIGYVDNEYIHPYTLIHEKWGVIRAEAYKDIDGVWFSIEIGL